MKNETTEPLPSSFTPIRYCTGGCATPGHVPHIYLVDPVDGKLNEPKLCPGNVGRVLELMDGDEPTGLGFIALDGFAL